MTTNLDPTIPASLDDFNAWADFWCYEIGVNVIPADTRNKVTYTKWSEWQDNPIPEELHNEWKRTNAFAQGMAVITGKVWRGDHAGEHFVCIDCDNLKAIEEFCTRNGITVSLKDDIGEKFIVEQHKDNTSKAHIYFYSKISFIAKSSSVNVVGAQRIENNEVPAIEVKSKNNTISYCTPSFHTKGEHYEIIGTSKPITLDSNAAKELMEHFDNICRRYGLQYLDIANGNGKALIPIHDLFRDNFVIHENNNRHEALLRVMESLLKRTVGIFSLDKIKQESYEWNQKHCLPPLDDKEFEKQWKDATKYIIPKIEEETTAAATAAFEEEEEEGIKLIQGKKQNDPQTILIDYLTQEVTKRTTFKTLLDTGEILYYDEEKKVYKFGGERVIDIEIERIGGPAISNHMKSEVRKHIQDMDSTVVERNAFDSNPDIINLENCLVNTRTLEEMPQTAQENLTLSKFPIRYNPNAECPVIEKFLGEVIIDLHKLREILKFWGYVLLKDCRFEKASMLLGGGSNGKSVLIKLLEAAVGGDENCSHVSLHDMEEDKFARARMFGKALNTYADLKSSKLRETGNIKTLVSGDSVEAQEKFKPRFSFRNRAKIIVSTNNPPETEDKTHAFYRRWLIVTFDRTFTDSEDPNDSNQVDTNLIPKLTTQKELAGFLNLGLKYLQVLIKENGFAEEPIDKIRREYEFKADHMARYLQDCCIIDFNKKDYETKTETLYNHYVRWCSERDQIIALDENVFGSKLTEHGIQKKRTTFMGEGRHYVYMPIVLRHALQEERGQADIITTALEKSAALRTTTDETVPEIIECPHCAVENEAGNSPLFTAKSAREVQLHIIFKHPGEDFDVITRV